MSSVSLKRLTSFDYAVGIGYLEAWVNPSTVAYCQPRRVSRGDDHQHALDGTLVHFLEEGGVLAVKESIGQVVALLQSGPRGLCRECYQELPESWRTLCDDCRAHHNGVHVDPEEATVS